VKSTRKLVMRFLKEHPEFDSRELLRFLIGNGLSAITAYAWVTRLKHEGYIEPVGAGRRHRYRVLKFEEVE